MDHKESIEIIQAGMAWAGWSSRQKEAMLLAMESLKKQIPQKAKKYTETQYGVGYGCPVCHSVGSLNYCSNCGQRMFY